MEDVNAEGMYKLEQKNKFYVGETIEIMKPDGRNVLAQVKGMKDAEGNPMESCPHPKQEIYVAFDEVLEIGDLLRRKEE